MNIFIGGSYFFDQNGAVKDNFVVWTHNQKLGACWLGGIKGYEEGFRLRKGESVVASWPNDVCFKIAMDFPSDTILLDSVLNTSHAIIGSPDLISFLKDYGIKDVEYLPICIFDHAGKIASKEYKIVHPLLVVNAVDEACSEFDRVFNSQLYDSITKLVLDEAKIPQDASIFRLKDIWTMIILKRKLADTLLNEGFSGIGFIDVIAYRNDT